MSKRELEKRIEDIGGEGPEDGIVIRIHKTVVDKDFNEIDEWTEVIEA